MCRTIIRNPIPVPRKLGLEDYSRRFPDVEREGRLRVELWPGRLLLEGLELFFREKKSSAEEAVGSSFVVLVPRSRPVSSFNHSLSPLLEGLRSLFHWSPG